MQYCLVCRSRRMSQSSDSAGGAKGAMMTVTGTFDTTDECAVVRTPRGPTRLGDCLADLVRSLTHVPLSIRRLGDGFGRVWQRARLQASQSPRSRR